MERLCALFFVTGEAATWTDDEDVSSTHSSCPSSDERTAAAPPAICSSRSRALCDALSMP